MLLLGHWLNVGPKLVKVTAYQGPATGPMLVQVLQRARGVDDVEIELEDIVEAARQSRMVKTPYLTILQRKYRPQLIIACIFMIFQQFDVSVPNKRTCSCPRNVSLCITSKRPPQKWSM